jgi:hypothetical protein
MSGMGYPRSQRKRDITLACRCGLRRLWCVRVLLTVFTLAQAGRADSRRYHCGGNEAFSVCATRSLPNRSAKPAIISIQHADYCRIHRLAIDVHRFAFAHHADQLYNIFKRVKKMPTWLILLQICWVAGFIALGTWIWLLSMEMLRNLAPGVSAWKLTLLQRIPAPEQLTEMGRNVRRQYFCLLWIFFPYFVGGGLLIRFAKSAHH